jgi:hypothetical protein
VGTATVSINPDKICISRQVLHLHVIMEGYGCIKKFVLSKYSGPSSYDRLDVLTTKNFSCDLILSYDPHGVRKLQSEPRYACLWT